MNQILGIIGGIVGGIIWERIGNSPFGEIKTITPSWFLNFSKYSVHVHHWLGYLLLLLIIILIAYKTDRLFHPTALMIYSFFISAMIYGFLKFPGWRVFIE
jgi:hypothetical protein